MACDVCDGEGKYPIHNNCGKHVMNIKCPECYGSGLTEEEAGILNEEREQERRDAEQRLKYDAAMAEMRATA